MKKLSLMLPAALILLGLGFVNPQVVKAGAADGDALHDRADKLRTALLSGTPDEIFNKLAPWMRGRADLFVERLPQYLEEELGKYPKDKLDEVRKALKENVVETLSRHDPENTMNVKTFDDVLKLSGAQLLALDVDVLRMQHEEKLKEHREAKWHEVNRAIYSVDESLRWLDTDGKVERTYGAVSFVNRFHDCIEVTCVAEGDAWQVVNFKVKLGNYNLRLNQSDLLDDPTFKIMGNEVLSAKRTEGEQFLGAGRDYCRVEYSKSGVAPKKLSDSIKLDTFKGVYFKLRDKVYKKPDANRGALVAEAVDSDDDLGWGVIYFDYASGNSDITWYETKDDLDMALKNFETPK